MTLTLPLTKPLEISALTSAMKSVVAEVEGLSHLGTTLQVRRLTRDFTTTEIQQLTQALADHDAAAIQQARAARFTLQATERAKLPANLTLPERIRRLEIILNLD